MRALNWLEDGEGTDLECVRSVESITAVRFPADFIDFVMKNAGASNPDESEFVIERFGERELFGNFGHVLTMGDSGSDSVLGTMRNLGDQIPRGVIPIVGTGSGDYICIDGRPTAQSTIAYFHHGRTGGEAVVPLAGTFSQFLIMLRQPAEQ
jgi:hypothetical protein